MPRREAHTWGVLGEGVGTCRDVTGQRGRPDTPRPRHWRWGGGGGLQKGGRAQRGVVGSRCETESLRSCGLASEALPGAALSWRPVTRPVRAGHWRRERGVDGGKILLPERGAGEHHEAARSKIIFARPPDSTRRRARKTQQERGKDEYRRSRVRSRYTLFFTRSLPYHACYTAQGAIQASRGRPNP